MTDIGFYHLTGMPLERALPKLLERVLRSGKRAVVMAGSEERVESLNAMLWTYRQDSFLPHGSARDANPEAQPVWLTAKDENPINALSGRDRYQVLRQTWSRHVDPTT